MDIILVIVVVVAVLVLGLLLYYCFNSKLCERSSTVVRSRTNRNATVINISSEGNRRSRPFRRNDNELPTIHTLQRTVQVLVVRVPDGDGVKAVDVETGQDLDVRLIGIDAPEMKGRQPFALEAKLYLQDLVLDNYVLLTKYSKDQYGRILGNLKVPGLVDNVALEMVKVGLACVYVGRGAEYGGMRAEFQRAESYAKKQKIGMWSLDNVELPMNYKRKQRDLNP